MQVATIVPGQGRWFWSVVPLRKPCVFFAFQAYSFFLNIF